MKAKSRRIKELEAQLDDVRSFYIKKVKELEMKLAENHPTAKRRGSVSSSRKEKDDFGKGRKGRRGSVEEVTTTERGVQTDHTSTAVPSATSWATPNYNGPPPPSMPAYGNLSSAIPFGADFGAIPGAYRWPGMVAPTPMTAWAANAFDERRISSRRASEEHIPPEGGGLRKEIEGVKQQLQSLMALIANNRASESGTEAAAEMLTGSIPQRERPLSAAPAMKGRERRRSLEKHQADARAPAFALEDAAVRQSFGSLLGRLDSIERQFEERSWQLKKRSLAADALRSSDADVDEVSK